MKDKAEQEAVDQMKSSPYNYSSTRWAAYQNKAMDSAGLGHLQFLAVGPDNTYKEKPEQYPDTSFGVGWKYRFIGWVDLDTGDISIRCGECSNCKKLEKVKHSVMACCNPPFSHADQDAVDVCNTELERLPCEATY